MAMAVIMAHLPTCALSHRTAIPWLTRLVRQRSRLALHSNSSKLDGKACASHRKLTEESVERNDAAPFGPLVGPRPALTAEDSVKLQLDALSKNDEPRKDHGLEVMYNFANAEGTLDGGSLSCYFGFPTDLYHFGHFSMKFKSRLKALILFKSYEIVNVRVDSDEQKASACIEVKTVGNDDHTKSWKFLMSKVSRGSRASCWLTDAIVKEGD